MVTTRQLLLLGKWAALLILGGFYERATAKLAGDAELTICGIDGD